MQIPFNGINVMNAGVLWPSARSVVWESDAAATWMMSRKDIKVIYISCRCELSYRRSMSSHTAESPPSLKADHADSLSLHETVIACNNN